MITRADHTPKFGFYTYFPIVFPPPGVTIPTVSIVAHNDMRKFWDT
jgi:hypothetical protein